MIESGDRRLRTSAAAPARGNLFTVNELARMGELSESREIRSAFNSLRMADVGDEPHDRSEPLTGGFFDVMVEIYQKRLVARDLISQSLATRSTQGLGGSPNTAGIQAEFNALYAGHEEEFKEELLKARDELGVLLARTWQGLNPNFLTYHDIVRRHAELLEAKKAAAPAYAARSVELAAAVAVPVRAVPRTNSRKRAARQR